MTRSSIHSPRERDPRLDDFDAFYESWYPRAVAIAYQKGISDPEAAAQECMLVMYQSDYIDQYREFHKDCDIPVSGPARHVGHRSKEASLDTWVGNILYRRIISMQRRELRRRSIAQMEALGDREFPVEDEFGFRARMRLVTEIIQDRYPEWRGLWSSVIYQVLEGEVTSGDRINRRDLAALAGVTQRGLEEALDRFIALVQADPELADLLDVDRSPAAVS